MAGHKHIVMIAPNGKRYEIPERSVPLYQSRGYKVADGEPPVARAEIPTIVAKMRAVPAPSEATVEKPEHDEGEGD